VFGAGQYAMRFWVKPDQLAKLNVTIPEIVNAINAQNKVNPAGQVGAEPVPKGQEFTYAVRAQGRLETEEEFGRIVVRASPDGSILRLKDAVSPVSATRLARAGASHGLHSHARELPQQSSSLATSIPAVQPAASSDVSR